MSAQAEAGASPAADCPVTSPEENTALARRVQEEALNARDLDVFDEVVAAGVLLHGAYPPEVVGRDAFKQHYDQLLTGFPDYRATVHLTAAEGDLVGVRWTAAGTNQGEFLGFPPTGRQATWSGVAVYRVACGQLVEEWSDVSGAGQLQQLGIAERVTPAAATPAA
jgi:steroid delta-isomerase-like uncharacterized protein